MNEDNVWMCVTDDIISKGVEYIKSWDPFTLTVMEFKEIAISHFSAFRFDEFLNAIFSITSCWTKVEVEGEFLNLDDT